jgi:hypothetical protein
MKFPLAGDIILARDMGGVNRKNDQGKARFPAYFNNLRGIRVSLIAAW